jgi:hypothetical protein
LLPFSGVASFYRPIRRLGAAVGRVTVMVTVVVVSVMVSVMVVMV